MQTAIKYALHKSTQKVVYINDANRGKSCECNCIQCGEVFEAVKGNIREWHFRHSSNSDCKGGPETAIHKLAKQIIAENTFMQLPTNGVTYCNIRVEQRLEKIIPDVVVTADGFDIHLEILVTHPVDKLKELFYSSGSYKSIEIDLRGVPYDIAPEDLAKQVLQSTANKRIIFWEAIAQEITQKQEGGDFGKLVITALGAYAIFRVMKFLLPQRKRY